MNNWTPAARTELEHYFRRLRTPLLASGADPSEVFDDLRRHIAHEAATARLPIVTELDIRQILARLGEPFLNGFRLDRGRADVETELPDDLPTDSAPLPRPEPQSSPERSTSEPPRPRLGSPSLVVFGIVLPLLTLLVEVFTGFCAQVFFNPIPSFWHIPIVAIVPLANLLALRLGSLEAPLQPRQLRLLGLSNGAAIFISAVYTIIFVPLLPPGIVAMIVGIGFLPCTPLFSLIATLTVRARLKERFGAAPGLLQGMGLALLLFACVDGTRYATSYALYLAASPEPARQQRGLGFLRWAGDEATMLRACYRTPAAQNMREVINFVLPADQQLPRLETETARRIFYRVTGKPFNSVAPGLLNSRLLPARDWERGTARVGGVIPGLSAVSSRIDAVLQPAAATGYLEWILEFRNDTGSQQEARAEILLPPDAVVSRLTLWINGEEREAAFAGSSQVRQAYERIVQARRDPVLVTHAGQDRVLMQCFPVPPHGGLMKVRLGITTPLAFASLDRASLPLPVITEQNFGTVDNLEHSLWIESTGELLDETGKLLRQTSKNGYQMLHGKFSSHTLHPRPVSVRRDPQSTLAWVKDDRARKPSTCFRN